MRNKMLLSQVIALIRVSFNTKGIKISNCGLIYSADKYGGSFSIKWKRGNGICGHEMMYLYFSYDHTEENYRGKRVVLKIYLFEKITHLKVGRIDEVKNSIFYWKPD